MSLECGSMLYALPTSPDVMNTPMKLLEILPVVDRKIRFRTHAAHSQRACVSSWQPHRGLPIPTGLCSKARGCGAVATPGSQCQVASTL